MMRACVISAPSDAAPGEGSGQSIDGRVLTHGDVKDLKLRGNQCQCPTCEDYFWSVGTFDAHLVRTPISLARYAVSCLSASAMLAKGWHRNAYGFWCRRRMSEAERQRRQAL